MPLFVTVKCFTLRDRAHNVAPSSKDLRSLRMRRFSSHYAVTRGRDASHHGRTRPPAFNFAESHLERRVRCRAQMRAKRRRAEAQGAWRENSGRANTTEAVPLPWLLAIIAIFNGVGQGSGFESAASPPHLR